MLAMSGGVDSSVCAYLLKEQGHEVIGVHFNIWSDPLAPAIDQLLPSKCCNAQVEARMKSVAKKLGIPLHTIDIRDEFKEHVVDHFLKEYECGRTPNPCVQCNRTIKFGTMIKMMEDLECDKIASGHYARVNEEDGEYHLLEAVDKEKDQSYFLYTLTQEKLEKVIFPLGGMKKQDVIKLAKKYEIPLPGDYRESQDVCFYPEKEPEEFLKRHLKTSKPGEIKTEDSEVVGEHKGLPFYTIGQRKGLNIGGLKIPLHVTKKDTKTNTLFVASAGADRNIEVIASELNWIAWTPPKNEEIELEARINSLGKRRKGTLKVSDGVANFTFFEPVRGIAPGQSLVLYRGDEILGGGLISE